MSSYLVDLRKKIVATYEAGNTSIRKVAKQFQVATKTVQSLLNQYRETEDLSPKALGSQIKSPLEAYQQKTSKSWQNIQIGRYGNTVKK